LRLEAALDDCLGLKTLSIRAASIGSLRLQVGTMTRIVEHDVNQLPPERWPTTPIYVYTHAEVDRV
jgi:hypothetical protein